MLYFIKRGPRPSYHNAPFHPAILCDRKRVAQQETCYSGNQDSVWVHAAHEDRSGWLLTRWRGLVIEYGHLVRGFTLPDGTLAGFFHLHRSRTADGSQPTGLNEPWSLLPGAIWWSSRKMPAWIEAAGVIYPPDCFSQQRILEREALNGAGASRQIRPKWWPQEPFPAESSKVAQSSSV